MAAIGTAFIIFINDVTAGKSSVMDYEVHRAILPAEINHKNLIK